MALFANRANYSTTWFRSQNAALMDCCCNDWVYNKRRQETVEEKNKMPSEEVKGSNKEPRAKLRP